jgi:hypothetical protein
MRKGGFHCVGSLPAIGGVLVANEHKRRGPEKSGLALVAVSLECRQFERAAEWQLEGTSQMF